MLEFSAVTIAIIGGIIVRIRFLNLSFVVVGYNGFDIPDSISKRLSEISSDRQCFDNTKTVYQEALNKSGYNYNLSYNESHNEKQQPWKNPPRKTLWYNPPFSKNVKTNVGKFFLLSLMNTSLYHIYFTNFSIETRLILSQASCPKSTFVC